MEARNRRWGLGSVLAIGAFVSLIGWSAAVYGPGDAAASQQSGPRAYVQGPDRMLMEPELDSIQCLRRSNTFTTPIKKRAFVSDCMRRLLLVHALSPEGIRQGELMWTIPEFHDEQRLPNNPDEFGPLSMIFASPAASGFDNEGQLVEHGGRGMLAAVIVVDTTRGSNLSSNYARLGLRAGTNCLWLTYSPAAAVQWTAFVTLIPTRTDPCDYRHDPRPLAVSRTTYGMDFEVRDIPAVARFTWDDGDRPLLGVRCFTGWCDVGPARGDGAPAFTPRSLAAGVPGLGNRPEGRIVGWHDEQVLAEYGAGGVAVPGRIHATLFPAVTRYRNVGVFQPPGGGWGSAGPPVQIAELYIHDRLVAGNRYYDKWHLRQGNNAISLRWNGMTWVASVRNADGSRDWVNVERHLHFDAAVVSTARFRWASTDDGVWVACGQACCRMEGET